MTGQTKSAEVVEVALAAAFRHRDLMVGVPQGAAGSHAAQTPDGELLRARVPPRALEPGHGGDGVGGAQGADAAVAGEHLVAQIAGVGAEPPLVNAELRAEGAAARGENLQPAPAAQGTAVRSAIQGGWMSAAGFGENAPGKRLHVRGTAPGSRDGFLVVDRLCGDQLMVTLTEVLAEAATMAVEGTLLPVMVKV